MQTSPNVDAQAWIAISDIVQTCKKLLKQIPNSIDISDLTLRLEKAGKALSTVVTFLRLREKIQDIRTIAQMANENLNLTKKKDLGEITPDQFKILNQLVIEKIKTFEEEQK